MRFFGLDRFAQFFADGFIGFALEQPLQVLQIQRNRAPVTVDDRVFFEVIHALSQLVDLLDPRIQLAGGRLDVGAHRRAVLGGGLRDQAAVFERAFEPFAGVRILDVVRIEALGQHVVYCAFSRFGIGDGHAKVDRFSNSTEDQPERILPPLEGLVAQPKKHDRQRDDHCALDAEKRAGQDGLPCASA